MDMELFVEGKLTAKEPTAGLVEPALVLVAELEDNLALQWHNLELSEGGKFGLGVRNLAAGIHMVLRKTNKRLVLTHIKI